MALAKRLRVCTVQLTCPDDDVVAAVPTLPMGATGEILLRYNGAAKDYLSWGLNEEKLASDMHEANIQYTRIRYDKGKYDEYWHIVQNGVFYKKIDEKWYSYPLGDNVNTVSRPNPIPYINEESLCMEASDLHKRVRFAWHLRIIQHWIPIVRFFQNLVFLKLKSIAGFRMIRSIM